MELTTTQAAAKARIEARQAARRAELEAHNAEYRRIADESLRPKAWGEYAWCQANVGGN
jgi:hypothetical protein